MHSTNVKIISSTHISVSYIPQSRKKIHVINLLMMYPLQQQ